ncbi:MAG: hasO [Pedosphaera sp.]|nr:hasO [Pedosphaera sp.]
MHKLLHTQFEEQVRKTPGAVALLYENEIITYAELNARANQLARELQSAGVCAESLVAIYMDRSPEIVISIIAVLKAGGAYVPIDLAYPADRLKFMLEDSQAKVLLTQEKLLASLPPCGGRVICAEKVRRELLTGDLSAPNISTGITPDNAAYVMYTSGSTGRPKGVIITHRNVIRLFEATAGWFHFSETDTWSLFHSFAFDVSVWEMWGALLHGGKLVVASYLTTRSPQAFYELLAAKNVTVLCQTPSAFRQLMRTEAEMPAPKTLALRLIIFAGEALELQSLAPWFDRHGDVCPQLVNMYGITETTVHVTYRLITRRDLAAGSGSVIGRPIPDLDLLLLDEEQKPVAAGVPGEIWVGGPGVARGYLNRPELTAQRFIPHPFRGAAGGRLYRSGDLACLLPDGDLEYLGRIDQQVKIRGFRIELGEVESALNRHPDVCESVVIPREAMGGERRLVAYLVCRDRSPTVTTLREFLGKMLPEYMVPAAFVFMERLPLTVNGKVDRRALPPPGRQRPAMQTPYVAPTTPEEKALAEIWAEVLEIDEIGVHDNFFELGGDSIRSIQVLARAQHKGFKLSLQTLFSSLTIYALVRSSASENEDALPPLQPFDLLAPADRSELPHGLQDAYPMAMLQTGMLFHSQGNPASAIFHDVFSFRLNLPFDLDALQKAVERLVCRHAIFRTSFDVGHYSEPLQLVHKKGLIPLQVDDLRHLTAEQQHRALVDWVNAEKRRPFDWTKAPFVRLQVQRHGEASFQFIVSFHHSIMDGWSLAVMVAELFQDYHSSLSQGDERVIDAPQVSYAQFIRLERAVIDSQETRDFWNRKLQNPTIQTLPRWPRSLCKGGAEQVRGPEIDIDEKVFEGLKQLAQSSGVPLRTVLLAAHCRVMSFLAGQSDIITGLVSNGRPQVTDGERLIGLFLNTLPFRIDVADGTWRSLVRRTFLAETELVPFRRTPLPAIQNQLKSGSLFETAFDYVQFHVYRDVPGYQSNSFEEGHYFEANNFMLYVTFMLDATSSHLQFHFDYDPNELCEEQAAQLCGYYVNTLLAMAGDPEAQIHNHWLLSRAEQERMLVDWNHTAREFDRALCLHQLIERQVERSPNAVASAFEGRQLTYSELNQRANQVAVHLRTLGVGPETLVGVFMDRSLEMLIGMLGVLKAGGAYVPMDPAFPKARLASMAADAKLSVLLTQSKWESQLDHSSLCIVSVDALLAELAEETDLLPNPKTEINPSNLAYVIYTSGSTGKPKGVQVLHRALVNFLIAMAQTPGLSAQDKLLAVTTVSFDIAGLELFLPLTVGAQVIIAAAEMTLTPSSLAAEIDRHSITVMQATPTAWRMLVEAGWLGNPRLKILCGGEALSPELALKLRERCGSLWNLYGPTETTIWSTVYQVEPVNSQVPIGRPIANTEVYLLSSKLQPVPVGVDGDLYIGGEGLARGYLNQPELTAEKFVPHPFIQANGARLYKTGDIARYLPDGNLVWVGRCDDQVKVRGFRIELGDVAAALEQHEAVSAAVLLVDTASGPQNRLVAYWTARPNSAANTTDLRKHLEQRLPAYMIPAVFMEVNAFPLTPNGKVDRSQLPKPERSRPQLETSFAGPGNPLETMLAAFWQEVLERDQVGINDNFFDLGGYSIPVLQVISRIELNLGIHVPVATFFEFPTIAQLAEIISASPQEAAEPLPAGGK